MENRRWNAGCFSFGNSFYVILKDDILLENPSETTLSLFIASVQRPLCPSYTVHTFLFPRLLTITGRHGYPKMNRESLLRLWGSLWFCSLILWHVTFRWWTHLTPRSCSIKLKSLLRVASKINSHYKKFWSIRLVPYEGLSLCSMWQEPGCRPGDLIVPLNWLCNNLVR